MIVQLRELTEKITKGTTPSNIGADFADEGIMYFRSELIGKSKYVDKSKGLLYISPETHEKLKRSQICEGDILFSMAGVYLGKVSLVGKDDAPSNTNQAVAIIRFRENACNIEYIYYYMKQKWFNEMVCSYCAQAAQPNINLDQIGKLKIQLVDKRIQNRIVDILSKYDSLIENNTKRIKILEQMAENLYKEWFVRFRFPGYESTVFDNGIPKGWKRLRIEEVYETFSGGTPSRKKDEYYCNGSIPWIKTGELQDCILIDTEECITREAVNNSSAKIISPDSVLMAMYGVNIGMLGYTSIEATCNQACCAFKDKKISSSKHYLYYYLKSIRSYLISIGFGAAQQNLSQELIKNEKIIWPKKELILQFEDLIEPLYREMVIIKKKNDNLIKQRDLLLPRLMSGKLEIK